jgi:hypothetical protein
LKEQFIQTAGTHQWIYILDYNFNIGTRFPFFIYFFLSFSVSLAFFFQMLFILFILQFSGRKQLCCPPTSKTLFWCQVS